MKFIVFLCLISFCCFSASFKITVMHLNDFHGQLEQLPNGTGSIARIKTITDTMRKSHENIFLVDSGDAVSGNTLSNFFRGESVANIYSRFNFDAVTFGNHEFDYGIKQLQKLMNSSGLPYISSNTKINGKFPVPQYIIKQAGPVKIAFFALTTPDTRMMTNPDLNKGLEFLNPFKRAREMVSILSSRADVIVALTHTGFNFDKEIAEQVNGIDFIIGGHSHTIVKDPVKVRNTWIVQAGEKGKFLGILDIYGEFQNKRFILQTPRHTLIQVNTSFSENPEIKTLVKKYADIVSREYDVKIGEALTLLDGNRKIIRFQETNLGNFITDSIRSQANLDIMLVNSGSLRASIERGPISRRSIEDVLPYRNTLTVLYLSGAELIKAIEHGLSSLSRSDNTGRFLQVSGITFSYTDKNGVYKPDKIKVNGKPVDLTKKYLTGIPSFLKSGGDGFTIFSSISAVDHPYSMIPFQDIIVEYLNNNPQVNTQIEGRITNSSLSD